MQSLHETMHFLGVQFHDPDFGFDASDMARVRVEDQHDVYFHKIDDHSFEVFAPVGKAASVSPRLALQLLGVSSDAAALRQSAASLGLEPDTQNLILRQRIFVDAINEETLSSTLKQFFNTTIEAKATHVFSLLDPQKQIEDQVTGDQNQSTGPEKKSFADVQSENSDLLWLRA